MVATKAKGKTTVEEKKNLADTLAAFEKKGLGFGYTAKDNKFLPTSNIAIDWATGGGLPVGKIIEIYGKSGSGKSTLALQTMVECQQSGGTIVWADFERAFDANYAVQLGLDINAPTFIYFKPDSLEEGCDTIRDLIRTGEVSLVVIDSIAKMTTQSEMSGSMSDVTVADKAKALYKFCRMVLNALDDNDCTLVFLNHLLEQINTSMPGTKSTLTPGGNGVKYFASLRLECTVVQSNKPSNAVDQKYDSVDVQILVTKNRAASPFRKVIVRNEFGSGFSQIRAALEIASELNIVTKGTWTKVNDERLIKALGKDQYHGYNDFILDITQNPEARGLLVSIARELIGK